MVFGWFRKALWLIIFILLLYFLSARALISWVQWAPHQVSEVAERYFALDVQFEQLELEQTWTGFRLSAKGLSLDHQAWWLKAEQIDFDFHLLAPIWPSLPYGESLAINQASWQSKSIADASTHFELVPLLKAASKLWRRMDVSHFSIGLNKQWTLNIQSLVANRAERWNLLSQFELSYLDQQTASFQLSARLTEDYFGLLNTADIDIRQLEGLPVKALNDLFSLPAERLGELTDGQLRINAKAQIRQRELQALQLDVELEQLSWVDEAGLPSALSVRLMLEQDVGHFFKPSSAS